MTITLHRCPICKYPEIKGIYHLDIVAYMGCQTDIPELDQQSRNEDRTQMDNYLALMAFVAAGLGIAGVLLWVYFPR
jgi:hypothetical protein